MAQGLSMGFMSFIVSIGSVILQFGINQLGQMIITAHTAARRLFQILTLPLLMLTLTSATFVSQNLGAGRYERIAEGIKKADRFSLFYYLAATALVFFTGEQLIAWLSGSTEKQVLYNGAL